MGGFKPKKKKRAPKKGAKPPKSGPFSIARLKARRKSKQ